MKKNINQEMLHDLLNKSYSKLLHEQFKLELKRYIIHLQVDLAFFSFTRIFCQK